MCRIAVEGAGHDDVHVRVELLDGVGEEDEFLLTLFLLFRRVVEVNDDYLSVVGSVDRVVYDGGNRISGVHGRQNVLGIGPLDFLDKGDAAFAFAVAKVVLARDGPFEWRVEDMGPGGTLSLQCV